MRANSDLGLMVPDVRLFHNAKKCERYVKSRFGCMDGLLDTGAQMWYNDGRAVVLMSYDGRPETEAALLVHEAYHVATSHMDYLGEDEPGEEVMAYLVQTVSNGLFVAHARWKAKRSR